MNCAGLEETYVGTVARLGEPERADPLQPRHGRQPALLLFLGAQQGNRHHRQRGLDAHEGRQTQIATT